MDKQFIIFIFISLFIGFLLGATLILSLEPQASLSPASKQALVIKKAFVQELREKGILPTAPDSITDIYGKVSSIKDNQLTVVLENQFDDPLNEFLPKTMFVNIDDQTKIFKLKEKPTDIFNKEQEAFDKKMAQYGTETPADIMPPEPFDKVYIAISDIQPGDMINASSEINFKGKSEFTANSIQVENNQDNPAPEVNQ